MAVFPRFREPWAQCGTCGLDVPASRIRLHRKWGWQCTGKPGANCWDKAVDRDMQLAARRFPLAEGTRKTPAPLTHTDTEGI